MTSKIAVARFIGRLRPIQSKILLRATNARHGRAPANGQSTLRDMRQGVRSYPLSVLAQGVLLQTLLEPVLGSQDGEADEFERVDCVVAKAMSPVLLRNIWQYALPHPRRC